MLRRILKRPAFSLAVLVTLTLGIGANSAIFSVIDAVLLKPLPYPSSDHLMSLYEVNPRKKIDQGLVSPVRVDEWGRMSHSFSGIAGVYTESLAETSGSLPERLLVARVSPRFFTVLATPPLAGRTFTAEEERFGGPDVTILSERFWRSRFAGDPSAIGKTLRLNTSSYTIVGIAPESFSFPSPEVDLWIPCGLPPGVLTSRQADFYQAVGRMRDGVSVSSAQAELAQVQAQLGLQFPQTDAKWTVRIEPLKEDTIAGARRSLWILYSAVSLVLLIACANVACLLLAQAEQRRREIAIRFSIGARRWQVIRELLIESFYLALPGAICGLLLSIAGAGLLRKAAAAFPRSEEIQIDWRIVAFTLSLSLLTTVLFGLFPAFNATREETGAALASTGSRTQIGGTGRALSVLVTAQIALAIVLLVGAGLLIRTMFHIGQMQLGFEPAKVLALRISASWGETNNPDRVVQRMMRTLETLRAIPGVESAAITYSLPNQTKEYPQQFTIVDRDSNGEKLTADTQGGSADYFRTLGIPILSGQTCRDNIDPKAPTYALVDRNFADRFFPGDNPIGHSVKFQTQPIEIIGIVGNTRQHGPAHDPVPTIYSCLIPRYFPDPQYLVRTAADPSLIAGAIRRQIRSIEPNRAVYSVTRVDEAISESLSARRFQTILLGLFAATALLLAVVGLYGVMSFFVSTRTREIGLRVALGARPAQIVTRIFRTAATMTFSGIAIGLAASTLLTREIQNQLYGIARIDPLTFIAVPLLLAIVAATAAWAPAYRAMKVDPIEALRQE